MQKVQFIQKMYGQRDVSTVKQTFLQDDRHSSFKLIQSSSKLINVNFQMLLFKQL